MSKILISILVLFVTSMHSQQYHFDLMTLYKTDSNGYSFDRLVYSNTKNSNHFLIVGGNPDSKTASLYDLEARNMHHFDIVESNYNNQVEFQFNYVKSGVIKSQPFDSHVFEVENLEPEGDLKKVKVTIYKNSKKKLVVGMQILTMKKSETNLFPLFRVSGFHPFEFWEKLFIDGNYMVISGEGKSYIGRDFSAKLVMERAIDFDLPVPQKP